jgi:hypothetical protein
LDQNKLCAANTVELKERLHTIFTMTLDVMKECKQGSPEMDCCFRMMRAYYDCVSI